MWPRQELGTELRRLRSIAGMTQPDMARRLGLSQAKVSRMETGRYRPDMDVVRAWLNVVGSEGAERERLIALAEAAQTDIIGWRGFFRGTITAGQRRLIRQDAVAWRIRQLEQFEVPGPFQTAEYARQAVIATGLDDDEDLDEAVAVRLERSRRLRATGAPEYQVIIAEAALRLRPKHVDLATHRDVLHELLASADVPNITVRVVPLDANPERPARSAFTISYFAPETGEPTVVDVELDRMQITMSRPDDVDGYETVWRRMEDAALDPQESLAFIARLADLR
jgi:transcriptional regulator with XRE-family HTH domain